METVHGMKLPGKAISITMAFDEGGYRLTNITYNFKLLNNEYVAVLKMWENENIPIFILNRMGDEKNPQSENILRITSRDTSVEPFGTHSDEVSQALFEDCMMYILWVL